MESKRKKRPVGVELLSSTDQQETVVTTTTDQVVAQREAGGADAFTRARHLRHANVLAVSIVRLTRVAGGTCSSAKDVNQTAT